MEKLIVKFKKLNPTAVIPKQGTPGSAGFDLTAIRKELSNPDMMDVVTFYTGISVEIPKGYVGLIFPRSSIVKTSLILSNCVGVIDSDYRGEIMAKFYNLEIFSKPYKTGDRIAQMIIMPVPEVEYVEADELSDTARGSGGYGSTGK